MALDNNGNNAGRHAASGQGAANRGQQRPTGQRPVQTQRQAQPQRSAQPQRQTQHQRPVQQQRPAQAQRTAQSQMQRQVPQRSAQQRPSGAAAQRATAQSQLTMTKRELKRAEKEQRKYQKMMEKAYGQDQKKRAAAAVPAAGAAAQQASGPFASSNAGMPDQNGKGQKKGGKKGSGKKGWRIVFIISLIVFLVGLVSVGTIMYSYWKGQRAYSEVAEAFDTTDTASPTLKDLKVDWAALREKNPDIVAWIYIPGTEVNYPVVKGTDNYHYLKTDFNGETNWVVSPGTIFMDFRNDGTCTEDLTVIYGHNMNDGSMFSQIAAFDTKNQFNDHRDVYLLTPAGNLRLTSFGLKHGGADDPQIGPDLSADKMDLLIRTAIGQSVVTPDGTLPDASAIGNVFVLSTCDNLAINGRYLLYCYVAESTLDGVSAVSGGHRAEDDAAQALSEASAQAVGDSGSEEADKAA